MPAIRRSRTRGNRCTVIAGSPEPQGISTSGERAGKPTLRLVVSQNSAAPETTGDDDEPRSPRCAASTCTPSKGPTGRDRPQLERLVRYITRPPPIAQERIVRRP